MTGWHDASLRLLVVISLAILIGLPGPAEVNAQEASDDSARGSARPHGITSRMTVTCLGERGATVITSVTNTGKVAVTLFEFASRFVFRGPHGTQFGLEVFILIIPSTIAPGEPWTYELAIADDLLPHEPWVSFQWRHKVDLTLWFEGYARPVRRQFVVRGCD